MKINKKSKRTPIYIYFLLSKIILTGGIYFLLKNLLNIICQHLYVSHVNASEIVNIVGIIAIFVILFAGNYFGEGLFVSRLEITAEFSSNGEKLKRLSEYNYKGFKGHEEIYQKLANNSHLLNNRMINKKASEDYSKENYRDIIFSNIVKYSSSPNAINLITEYFDKGTMFQLLEKLENENFFDFKKFLYSFYNNNINGLVAFLDVILNQANEKSMSIITKFLPTYIEKINSKISKVEYDLLIEKIVDIVVFSPVINFDMLYNLYKIENDEVKEEIFNHPLFTMEKYIQAFANDTDDNENMKVLIGE